jgi:hypothetical protein
LSDRHAYQTRYPAICRHFATFHTKKTSVLFHTLFSRDLEARCMQKRSPQSCSRYGFVESLFGGGLKNSSLYGETFFLLAGRWVLHGKSAAADCPDVRRE